MKIVGFPVDISRSQDPRLIRGWRTRQTVLQTALDLIQAGDLQPTPSAIAALSGIAREEILRAFLTVDDLHAAVFDLAVSRTFVQTGPVDVDASLASRIDLLVADRAQLFEEWLPVWHFAKRVGQTSPAVGARVSEFRRQLRAGLADWFAAELRPLEPTVRTMVLDSLDAAFGLDSWLNLRHQRRLSPNHASRTWRFAAQSVALQTLAAPVAMAAALG